MARGETGYETLYGAGLVPDCLNVDIDSWNELLAQIDALSLASECPIKWLFLDALGGFERLCHEHVCQAKFKGNWGQDGEGGFVSYGKGPDIAVSEWLLLLQALDRIRTKHNVGIFILSHVTTKTFKNPDGADFDRYESECHQKTRGATHKWADAVLFYRYNVVVTDEKKGKGKALGSGARIMHCVRSDAYDAKNRYGMPEIIIVPDNPQAAWNELEKAFTRDEAQTTEKDS